VPPGSETPPVRGDGQVKVTVFGLDPSTISLASIAGWSLTPGWSGTHESSYLAGIGERSAWLYSVRRTTCGALRAGIENVAVVRWPGSSP
jgi:hypothetical protein